MNIEINDSCKTSKNKNNYHIRYSDSCYNIKRIKNKKSEEIKDVQDNSPNLYLKIPGKKSLKKASKSKYFIENSLRRKKTTFEKKEKEEKKKKGESDFHKIQTFNPKNKNSINSQEKYFSPQYKKKQNFNINKNANNNDILKLVKLTNKIYENEDHFQKKLINKKNCENISPNPRVKINNILSGKFNNLLSQNKKLSFGLNYKLCKDLLPENDNQNNFFKRRLSSNIKPGDFNLFNRNKDSSNYSKLLKIKQNLKNCSKERENSKFFCKTQKNNNKFKLNNENQKVLSRAKTVKQSRNKDENNYYGKLEEKRERTTFRAHKKIKLNKMNTQKINVNKIDFNKSQIQNVDVNPKENINNKNKLKKYRKSWCFFCCLNDEPIDSDNEN